MSGAIRIQHDDIVKHIEEFFEEFFKELSKSHKQMIHEREKLLALRSHYLFICGDIKPDLIVYTNETYTAPFIAFEIESGGINYYNVIKYKNLGILAPRFIVEVCNKKLRKPQKLRTLMDISYSYGWRLIHMHNAEVLGSAEKVACRVLMELIGILIHDLKLDSEFVIQYISCLENVFSHMRESTKFCNARFIKILRLGEPNQEHKLYLDRTIQKYNVRNGYSVDLGEEASILILESYCREEIRENSLKLWWSSFSHTELERNDKVFEKILNNYDVLIISDIGISVNLKISDTIRYSIGDILEKFLELMKHGPKVLVITGGMAIREYHQVLRKMWMESKVIYDRSLHIKRYGRSDIYIPSGLSFKGYNKVEVDNTTQVHAL